jgi:hypothetical protein
MVFIPAALAALGAAAGASAATAAAVGATIASTGVALLGTGASALASHNAAEFQAKLQQSQAQQAQDQASVKAGEVARESKQRTAATRAGGLQNGFELTGSIGDLLAQTERQGQLDYLTAVYDGSVQATGLQASAQMSKRAASNALIGGALGAGAQALGGVGQFYKMRGASINVSGT